MKFRFLDGVVSADGGQNGRVVTEVTFPPSEDYVGTPFHRPLQVPFTIVLEALAASAGRLIEVVTDNKAVALMVKVEKANFLYPVSAGDKLLVHSEMIGIQDKTGEKAGMAHAKATGWVGERTVAEAQIVYLCVPVKLTHGGSGHSG